MGSIGPLEILVVLVVALIVLGPNRLPEAARSVGKAVAELRRMTTGLQGEVRDAFSEAPPTYPRPAAAALPERPEDADVTERATVAEPDPVDAVPPPSSLADGASPTDQPHD